ncbi:MAG: kinase/pyrophosphorylase [Bacteroidales bacterium]|nr:kinase/pyrophosphorylase [Bacteroidales bacterium]
MAYQIFIISDGTGRTAEQVLKAALTQFEDTQTETRIYPLVKTKQQVLEIMDEARTLHGLVVHTVVRSELRDIINKQGRLCSLDTIDLMGPILAQLSHHFSFLPSEKPGMYYELNKSYFKRIEAVEYTLRHDDGQRIEELDKAEIVILGVSRTFKTPVSIYLAHKGWLVANVPIILGMNLPEQLFKLPAHRVFGLITSATHLGQLRKIRETHLGGNVGEYAKPSFIMKELEYANSIYRRQPKWSVIDITNKPVEEISMEIIAGLRSRNKRAENFS